MLVKKCWSLKCWKNINYKIFSAEWKFHLPINLNQNKKVWWSNIGLEFFIKLFCESLGGYRPRREWMDNTKNVENG